MDLITYALCRKLIKRSIESLGDIFTLKGNVDSVQSLPSTGNKAGDIYLVGPNQDGSYDEYYWTSDGEWEIMGSTGPGFDGVITEEAMYKGEDGTGTIENPAEGTILDVVNSKVLKTETWGNQNWENGTIEIIGAEPVEKIAYRNELCADANPRIPSDPEYNENDNLENYWDTPWHFIEWLQKWDQNEGLYNYFSAIEQEGAFTYDPTQKTIEPTTGLNMSWITNWNEDYGFSAAIHNGNNSFITEEIHIEKAPETEDWVLVYGEGFYLFDGRQVKLTNGENEFFIDNSEKSDYILKELEKFDEDEFVKKSGDTMTGKLTVPTLSVGNNNTVDDGCVGEGDHVQARNMNSHAEGYYTHASGENSHAEGNSTNALNQSQHVQGEWNIQDHTGTASTRGTYAHIVGNGTRESARSNAHTLDWSGNAWFAGDVYVGSTSGTNKDAGSKKLATDDTFIGTNGTENGSKGLVPAPTSQDTNKYLKADGTWDTPQGGGGSYMAGDYIDITNNEISITGIVPNGSTRTPLTLTTGQYYYCRDEGDPVTLMTEANSGYYKVDNNTNTSQDYVFQFSSAIGDDKYVIFAMDGNNTSLYDYILSNPISFHNQTGATKYYENAYFGVTLKPGESFIISCESTDLYTPSAYLISVTSRETLQPTLGYYFTAAEGYPIEIDDILEEPWGYFVYENTGNSGVFGFKICSYSNDCPLFAITDSSDIVLGFSNSSIDFAYEPRMIGVYLNSGDKIYFNTYISGYTPSIEVYSEDTAILDSYTKFTDTFVGTNGTSNGKAGVVPAPTANDTNKYLKGDGTWGTVSAGSSDYDDLTDKPQINGVTLSGNKTSADLGLDMVILSYGNSTWQDFINAYNRNAVVYCRASSASDPASGSQTRLAFMAYVNNATNPTEVEFQYYRSVSTKTASQQGDQVFVYKLTSSGTWTVTTRENGSKVVAGTNMTSTYSNGTLTLNVSDNVSEGTKEYVRNLLEEFARANNLTMPE